MTTSKLERRELPVKRYPIITVDTANPDPTTAINAFLWCMTRARELRLMPPTEHGLAEHLFRETASVIFYSSMRGVVAIVGDDDLVNDDDDLEFIKFVTERKQKALKERREKAVAAVAEIAALLDRAQQEPTDGQT